MMPSIMEYEGSGLKDDLLIMRRCARLRGNNPGGKPAAFITSWSWLVLGPMESVVFLAKKKTLVLGGFEIRI